MDHKRLSELFEEFAQQIEDWHTLYLDSIAGYSILYKRLIKKQNDKKAILGSHEYATADFQDTCSISYKNLCNEDFTPVAMRPLMKQGDVKKRICKDGKNYLLLGNQCVVLAYSYWEEYLRIEMGIALGFLVKGSKNSEATRKVLNKHVKSNFWGDMKILRHSILHNNGIATSEVSKCKVITCFVTGKPIELDYAKMRAIFLMMGLYRNELHKLSLPPSRGIIVRRK